MDKRDNTKGIEKRIGGMKGKKDILKGREKMDKRKMTKRKRYMKGGYEE